MSSVCLVQETRNAREKLSTRIFVRLYGGCGTELGDLAKIVPEASQAEQDSPLPPDVGELLARKPQAPCSLI